MAIFKNPFSGKKKAGSKTEDFDLDFDLSDDFSFDKIEASDKSGSIAGKSNVDKKRSVTTKAFKGAISGAKSAFFNESTVRSAAHSALPREYKVIFERGEEISGHLSNTYAEAIKELKPGAKRLANVLKKFSNEENSRSRRIAEKIKDVFGIYDGTPSVSKSQQEEQAIETALGSIFNQTIAAQEKLRSEESAKESVQQDLDRQVESKRFKTQYDTLRTIGEAVTTHVQYDMQVTQAYHKKSLELQMRQYFVASELLTASKTFFEATKVQQDAIVKNTAMPDYVKLTNTERFTEVARTKFFDRMQKRITDPSAALGRMATKLNAVMKEKLRSGVSAFTDALGGVEDSMEMGSTMGDLGMDDGSTSMPHLLSSALTSQLARGPIDKLMHKLGKGARRFIPQGGKIDRTGKKLAGYAINPQAGLYDAHQSEFLKKAIEGGGFTGFMGELASEILKAGAFSTPDMKLAHQGGLQDLTKVDKASFDTKAYRSLTDIIPGYLAKILKENKRLADAWSAPETVEELRYDFETSKFITTSGMKEKIKSKLDKGSNKEVIRKQIDTFMTETGLNRRVPEDQRKHLETALFTWVVNGKPITFKSIGSEEFIRTIPAKNRKVLGDILRKFSSTPLDNFTGDGKNLKSITEKEGMDLMSAGIHGRTELQVLAQEYANAGQTDLLEELGLIRTTDKYGNFDPTIQNSALLRSVLAESDIHAKKGIRPAQQGSILDKLTGIKNYAWDYKPGKGDGGSHFGPMAQDIHSKFGGGAAPGTNRIDLVTMNGINMQAIQDLNEKVETKVADVKTGDAMLDVLHGIHRDTTSIDQTLLKMDNKFFAGLNLDIDGGINKIGIFAKLMGDKFIDGKDRLVNSDIVGSAKEKGKRLSDRLFGYARSKSDGLGGSVSRVMAAILATGVKAAEKVTDGFKTATKVTKNNILTPIGKRIGSMLEKGTDKDLTNKASELMKGAWDLAGSVYHTTKNIITKTIPSSIQDIWGKTKHMAESVAGFFDEPTDIYVKGENEPRLKAQMMRLNMYIDVNTKKIITRPGMISGPVATTDGNIIITTDDIVRGLVDGNGNEVEGLKWKIMRTLKNAAMQGFERMQSIFNKVKNKFTGDAEGIFDKLKSSTGSRDIHHRIYNVLLDIRDIHLKGKRGKLKLRSIVDEAGLPTKPKTKDVKEILSKKADEAKEMMGSAYAKITSDETKDKINDLKDKASAEIGKLSSRVQSSSWFGTVKKFIGKAKDRIGGLRAFNDVDGDGKRDGNWLDRLKAKQERKAAMDKEKEDEIAASKEGHGMRYKGDNIFDNLFDKLSGIKSALGTVGGAVGSVAGALGLGKLLGVGGATAAGTAGTAAAGAAAKTGLLAKAGGMVGATVKTMASAALNPLPYLKAGAKGLLGALRLGGAAIKGGGAVMAGTAALGKTILGGLGMAGTGIFASTVLPFVAGAAAIAGTAYAGYKAWKWLTKKHKAFAVDKIRLRQYGLLDSDESNYHRIWALESYIESNAQEIKGGQVIIHASKIDNETLFKIFDISPDSEEHRQKIQSFNMWFMRRFIPVYLNHRQALLTTNPKLKSDQYEKLKTAELKKYISLISVPDDVYNITDSPFIDREYVQAIKADYQKEIEAFNKILPKDTPPKNPALPNKKVEPKTIQDKETIDPEKDKESAVKDPGTRHPNEVKPDLGTTSNKSTSGKTYADSNMSSGEGDGSEPKSSTTSKPSIPSSTSKTAPMANTPMGQGFGADEFMRVGNNVNIDNLHPIMLQRLRGMIEEYGQLTGKTVSIESAYRSIEDQTKLRAKYGNRAALPGKSLHEFGLAIDADRGSLNEMEKLGLMRKYGFTRPVGGEPWHVEPAGIQLNLDKARKDPNYATQQIIASYGRGGGGYGTIPNAAQYKRNNELANNLLSQPIESIDPTTIVAGLNIPNTQKVDNTITAQSAANSIMSTVDKNAAKTDTSAIDMSAIDGLKGININSPDGLKQMIVAVSKATGVDPETMLSMAAMESDFKPDARAPTSSATGLYQFTDGTWNDVIKKYGHKYGFNSNTSRTDPLANALMAAEYLKQNESTLKKAKGSDNITVTDQYSAHFFGPSGASKMLGGDPNAYGRDVLPKAAKANYNIFYKQSGQPRTVREIYDLLTNKIDKKSERYSLKQFTSDINNIQVPTEPGMPSAPGTRIATGDARPYVPPPPRANTAGIPSVTNINRRRDEVIDPYNVTAMSQSMNNIHQTLNESLNVQTQMLSVLESIRNEISPEKFAELLGGLKGMPSMGRKPHTERIDDLPITLERRAI